MDAAMVTALAALIAGPVTAAAAMLTGRGANRAARDVGAVTLYDSLTQRLVAERDKAEMDERAADTRADAAEAKVAALEEEIHRLRGLVVDLGGRP